jgi:hypothetical protein
MPGKIDGKREAYIAEADNAKAHIGKDGQIHRSSPGIESKLMSSVAAEIAAKLLKPRGC